MSVARVLIVLLLLFSIFSTLTHVNLILLHFFSAATEEPLEIKGSSVKGTFVKAL